MSGQNVCRTVVVTNPQGLHMRPAAAVAKAAQQFQSRVSIRFGDKVVDGKSVFDMLLLAAECGAALELQADGSDAEAAVESVADVLALPALDD
jgi:phosphotransferase system HPr (HPr) family protein